MVERGEPLPEVGEGGQVLDPVAEGVSGVADLDEDDVEFVDLVVDLLQGTQRLVAGHAVLVV